MKATEKKELYQHTTVKVHPDTWKKMLKALDKKKYPTKNNLINVALANELKDIK